MSASRLIIASWMAQWAPNSALILNSLLKIRLYYFYNPDTTLHAAIAQPTRCPKDFGKAGHDSPVRSHAAHSFAGSANADAATPGPHRFLWNRYGRRSRHCWERLRAPARRLDFPSATSGRGSAHAWVSACGVCGTVHGECAGWDQGPSNAKSLRLSS